MRESKYQASLIKRLERMFPGVIILKNNSAHRQGITDLLLLYKTLWAALEVKASEDAEYQPNQEYWVGKLNDIGFAAFIYPENEEEVLGALQVAFGI